LQKIEVVGLASPNAILNVDDKPKECSMSDLTRAKDLQKNRMVAPVVTVRKEKEELKTGWFCQSCAFHFHSGSIIVSQQFLEWLGNGYRIFKFIYEPQNLVIKIALNGRNP